MPEVQGTLKLARPAVYLLGSHDGWQARAARELEPSVGCVFHRGAGPQPGQDPTLFMRWQLYWLEHVDRILYFALHDDLGDEFELGLVMGRLIGGPVLRRPPILGAAHPRARAALEAVAVLVLGEGVVVHCELGAAVAALRAATGGTP
jgi:hypothetical protein